MDWFAGVLLLSMKFMTLSSLRLRPFNSFTNVRYEPMTSYSSNRQIFLPNTQVTSRFPFLSGEHLSKTFRFTGYPGFDTPVFPIKPMSMAASTFDISLPSLNQQAAYADKSKLPRRNKPNFYSGQLKEQRGNKNNSPPGKQDPRGVTLDIRGGGYKIEPPRNSRPYKPPSASDTKHEIRNRRKNNNNNINNVGRESSLRPRSRRPNNKPPRSGGPQSPNQLYQNLNYEQSLKYISPNIEIESPENVLPYNPKLYKQMQHMIKQGAYGQLGNMRDAYLPFNSGIDSRLPSGNIPDSYKSTIAMQLLPGRTTEAISPQQQYANVGNSYPSFSPQFFSQFNTPDKTSTSQTSSDFYSKDPNTQVSANVQIDQNAYQQLQQTFQQDQTPNSMANFFYQQENSKIPSTDTYNSQMTNGQTNSQSSFVDSSPYLQAFYGNSAASLPTFPGFSSVATNAEYANQQINMQSSQQSSTDKQSYPIMPTTGYFQDPSQLGQANSYITMQQANAQQQSIQPLENEQVSSKFLENVRNLPSHSQNPGTISLQSPTAYEYSKDIHPQYANVEYSPSYNGNPEAYLQSNGDSIYSTTGQVSYKNKNQLNEEVDQEDVKQYPQTSSHSQSQISYLPDVSLFGKTPIASEQSSQTFSDSGSEIAGQNPESLLKLQYSTAQLTPEKLYYQQVGNGQGTSKFEFSAMDTPLPPVFSHATASINQNNANTGKEEAIEQNQKEVGERAALHLSEQMSVFVSENPPNRQFYLKPENYKTAHTEINNAYEKESALDSAANESKMKDKKDKKSFIRNIEKFSQVSYGGYGKDQSFDISPGLKIRDPFEDSLKPEFITRNATSEKLFHHYKTKYHDPVPASTAAPVEIKKPANTASVLSTHTLINTSASIDKTDYSLTPICALHSNTTYCLQDPEYPKEQIKQAIQLNRHPLDRFLLMDSMMGQNNAEKVDENVLKTASKSVSFSFEGNVVAPTPEATNNTGTGCSSNTYFAKPLRAINTAGQWKIIVNVEFADTESNYTQTVRIEECSRKGGLLGTCGGETISVCLQQYKLYRLLVWEPNKNFYIDAFLLPISCFCGSKHMSR